MREMLMRVMWMGCLVGGLLVTVACDDDRFKVPDSSQTLPKDVLERYRAEAILRPRPLPPKKRPPVRRTPTRRAPTSRPTSTSRPASLASSQASSRSTSQAVPKSRRLSGIEQLKRAIRLRAQARPKKLPKAAMSRFQRKDFALEPYFGHGDRVTALAVSPTGREALTGGVGRVVLRWSLTFRRRMQTLRGFVGAIHALGFSPDGRRFVVLEGRTTLSVWSRSGKLLRRWKTGGLRLSDVRFAPVDDVLISTGVQGEVAIWKVAEGRLLRKLSPCQRPKSKRAIPIGWAVQSMQRWWAVGCSDGRLWRRAWGRGAPVVTALSSPLTAVTIDAAGQQMAAATSDGRVHVWRVDQQGRLTLQGESHGHVRPVRHLRFFQGGERLLTGGDDSLIGVWQIQGGKLKLLRFLQHSDAVVGMSLRQGGREIISLDASGRLRAWSATGKQRFVSVAPPAGGHALSFSPDGKLLLSDAEKGTAALWTLQDGRRQLSLPGLPLRLISVWYAIDGNHIATVDPYNILFWDIRARRKIDVVRAPKDDEISVAIQGLDWAQAFYGTTRSGVALWTIAGQRLLYRHTEPQQVSALGLHAMRRLAVAGTARGKLFLYDFAEFRLRKRLQVTKEAISALRFSKDGKQLLVLSGRKATLFDVPSLKKRFQGTFPEALRSAVFLDDKTVALGRVDGRLSLWQPGVKILGAWAVCDGAVVAMETSRRHPFVAINCRDGSVRLLSQKQRKTLWTGWPLPGGGWLARGPQGELATSPAGLPLFFFSNRKRQLTLDSFAGGWLAPAKLATSMKRLFPVQKKKKLPQKPR